MAGQDTTTDRVPWGPRVRAALYPYASWGVAHVFRTPVHRLPSREARGGLKAREVKGLELPALAAAFDRPAGTLALRASRGDRVVCAFAGDLPIHMRWFSSLATEILELGLLLSPGPGEVYTYDATTLTGWRGKGAMGLARRCMFELLVDDGVRLVWNYILSHNQASLAALRPESQLMQSVPFLRVGRRSPWLFAPPGPPLVPAPGHGPERRPAANADAEPFRIVGAPSR